MLGLLVVLGGFASYYWTHRTREFRGTVQCGLVSIPEDPCTGVALITADGVYELDLEAIPQWRGSNVRKLGGKHVVVRGTLRVWRGPFVHHQRIRAHDLQLSPASTASAPANGGG
jgi:hypothetical protein